MSKLIKKVEFGIFKFELFDDSFVYTKKAGTGLKILGGAFNLMRDLNSNPMDNLINAVKGDPDRIDMDDNNVHVVLSDISQVELQRGSWGSNSVFSVIAHGGKPFIFKMPLSKDNLDELENLRQEIYEAINKVKTGSKTAGNIDDLEKLANLKNKGIITEEEFNAKKKQILGL